MLYTDIKLTVPTGSKYEHNKIGKSHYLYFRLNAYRKDNKLYHERKSVGKIMFDEELETEYFIPNENYYKLVLKQDPPVGTTVKGVGRTPKIKKSTSPETYAEIKDESCLGFGFNIACYAIAKELQLDTILEESFGTEMTRQIMAAGVFFAAGAPGGFTNIDHFTQRNMCFTGEILTSQKLSELYSNLYRSERMSFFRKWISKNLENDYACYDVTSISNYSELMPIIAYGYNRDKEALPQLNLGMFCGLESKLPLFYCEYNGNINDFTNYPYVMEQAEVVGLNNKFTIVMDGGFATTATFDNINMKGRNFIVGAPLDFCHDVKSKVEDWRCTNFFENQNIVIHDEESFRYHEIPYEINNLKTRLIMYKSPESTMSQERTLTAHINRLEATLNGLTTISENQTSKFKPFFKITINADKTFTFEKDEVLYKKALELCGCFAIFCNVDKLSAGSILEIYRAKDCIEKLFAVIKNDILDERLAVKSVEAINGKLFIAFIGLILRTVLKQRLSDFTSGNRIGLDSAISRLCDIECRKVNNTWILSKALTKQQKELVKILNLPVNYLDI